MKGRGLSPKISRGEQGIGGSALQASTESLWGGGTGLSYPGSISVVIPSFNHAAYIEQCVESVLRQDRRVDEIIVVDDGSTDDTHSRLTRFRSRVRIDLGHHVGLRANVARGLAQASGDYVSILASDDELTPGACRILAHVLDRHPRVGLVYGEVCSVDKDGTTIQGRRDERPIGQQADPIPLIAKNFISAPAALARRRALLGVPAPRQMYCGDWEWWLSLMIVGGWDIYGVPDVVAKYRRHEGSLSTAARLSRERAALDMFTDLGARAKDSPPAVKKALSAAAYRQQEHLAWLELEEGHFDESRRWFAMVVRQARIPPAAVAAGSMFARLPWLYQTWSRRRHSPKAGRGDFSKSNL